MSDRAAGRNRLDEAASPYLRQHADNPVHWQPWDDQALAEACDRDVPIFLSVGYSACHWCHVMEEESFADSAIAEVLNDHYVPIKVDREERPDVDRIYQTICQLVTRSGGWPLSVWLTPDGRPFYVGTYFPNEERHGRPAFRELLEGLAETWENDRAEIEDRADQWMQAIKGEVEEVDEPGSLPEDDTLERAADTALRSADRESGGFGTNGPKFPQPTRIELLLRAHDRTGRDAYRAVAVDALDAMATRGLFDHIGGGFHRYATDREWTVPHFEKMLYDNAELPRVYLAGYQVTGDERYAEVVTDTLSFVTRELTNPDGGFYSTLDAQSERDGEREEGAFYVWTPAEIRAAVPDDTDAELFIDRYGITPDGNFEGQNVLVEASALDSLAEEYDLGIDDVVARLQRAREAAFEARAQRPRPPRDEKILAGWNGLMISAFAEAAIVLDPAYAGPAEAALAFIHNHLWDGDRLHRRYKDGDVAVDGYLDDYAFLAHGAFTLYEATGDVNHLGFALDLTRRIETEFWDADTGALYFTPTSGEDLAARPQDLTDQSTRSSAAVAIDVLLSLSHFVPHDRFDSIAARALETYGSRINSNPLQHASFASAADRRATGSLEFTVVADTLPADWRAQIGATYVPNRILSVRPRELAEWLDTLGLDEAPPIWADRDGTDAPTIYTCRSFTCSPPQTDIDAALEWAADLAPT